MNDDLGVFPFQETSIYIYILYIYILVGLEYSRIARDPSNLIDLIG